MSEPRKEDRQLALDIRCGGDGCLLMMVCKEDVPHIDREECVSCTEDAVLLIVKAREHDRAVIDKCKAALKRAVSFTYPNDDLRHLAEQALAAIKEMGGGE